MAIMEPEQIKTFREANGWSQSDLGKRCGVDQATISRIERGHPIARPVRLHLERLMRTTAKRKKETA